MAKYAYFFRYGKLSSVFQTAPCITVALLIAKVKHIIIASMHIHYPPRVES